MTADGWGGIFLYPESFAVRALLGSLAAVTLAMIAVRYGLIRSSLARRLLILAPVLTAASAGVASTGQVYLPKLWMAVPDTGAVAALLGALDGVGSPRREYDVLFVAYAMIVVVLLARRLSGMLAVRLVLRRTSEPVGYGTVVALTQRLAIGMGIKTPHVALISGCPGGAFTVGTLRPKVVVDADLIGELDGGELEGLLAHELAHIKRRDTLLCLAVGVFRDLTFFLPTLHLAARWLRSEQEESADELASAHTRRPVALASGILKVWDAHRGRNRLRMACAAVPTGRAVAAGGFGGGLEVTGAARIITQRVQRLIEDAPAPSVWRRRAEVGFASAVTAAAVGAALSVPAWVAMQLDNEALFVGILSTPPASPVESPAFATFRALTSDTAPATASAEPSPTTTVPSASTMPEGCPCVETPTQLRMGTPAGAAADSGGLVWTEEEDYEAWRLRKPQDRSTFRVHRDLLTLNGADQQIGFFTVAGGRDLR